MATTDYTATAPDYSAWAGTGPNATHIYDAGDSDAMILFRAVVNREISALVKRGVDVNEAMSVYDPETLASGITVTHTAECRYCGRDITWTTAAWEPADTNAPYDERGNYTCDECAARPLNERGQD